MLIKLYDVPTEGEINSLNAYEYFVRKMDTKIPDELWESINSAFAKVWNDKLGIGRHFYWDEIPLMVRNVLSEEKKLVPNDIIEKVTLLILEYIESNNGIIT